MNKIIVVGHPQSGFEGVEELLLNGGMAEAKSSRREGLMPAQISETLVKVHGAVPVQQVCVADQLAQIEVAPVWQGLALDLMLANMEQSLWGWADTQAIYLLDYWRSQDPQTVFVLVFDEPKSIFTRQSLDQADAKPEQVEARSNAWVAYNSALLSFHLRHPERSMLVHAGQVRKHSQSYLQQVSAHIDAPLQLASDEVNVNRDLAAAAGGGESVALELEINDLSKSQVLRHTHGQGFSGNALADWLAQQLLQDYPQMEELYEQLQAAASMPQRSNQTEADSQLVTADLAGNLRRMAWTTFVHQQSILQECVLRLEQMSKALDEQAVQKQLLDLRIEQLTITQTLAQQKAQEQQLLLSSSMNKLQVTDHENHLLLEHLLKVQEELESNQFQVMQQKQALEELHRVKCDLQSAKNQVNQLQSYQSQSGFVA